MEIVNVLRDEQQVAGPFTIKPGKGHMRCIRLHGAQPGTSRIVEGMNNRGIPPESLWRCNIFDAMAFP